MLTGKMQACRIYRTDSTDSRYHERRRSSVKRHMKNAPAPTPGKKGKRYPKVYRNGEGHYKTKSTLYEYPTKDYPYSTQNYKGRGRLTSPGGTVTDVDPEYTRTITDRRKNIQGVSYHPHGNKKGFKRAEEIYPASSSSRLRRRCRG